MFKKMNSAIPIVFGLVSLSLASLGLRELIKEVTLAYKSKLG